MVEDSIRIAYDYQIFVPQTYGGISRYFCRLASSLVELPGTIPKIIAPIHFNNYARQLPSDLVSGKWIPRLRKCSPLVLSLNSLIYKKRLRKFKPHIVHETYYSGREKLPINAAKIVTVYDMIHERFFNGNLSLKDKTTRVKLMSLKNSDHIICISESTRRDLLNFFDISASKVSVVYLGFDRMKINGDRHYRDLKNLTSEKPFILYVGSRTVWKNFHGLIKAYGASSFLQSSLNIVAFGGGKFSRRERQLFEQEGIPSHSIMQITGDDPLLASLYSSATVFVYPSLYEGFGFPPLEAFSAGCPVACSNTSSIPEVVGNAAKLFDPNDVDDIVNSITLLVCDTEVRNRCIAEGIERTKMFTWRKCAQKTLDIYRKYKSND